MDNGNCLSWLGQRYVSRSTDSIHVSLNVGAMGYSAGAAVGGALSAPQRPVVALTGDAAYAMGGMETHTAAEYGLAVVWIVLNNSGNAMVLNVQDGAFRRSDGVMYARPSAVRDVPRQMSVAHGSGCAECG